MWKKLITNVVFPLISIVSIWINVNQHLSIKYLHKELAAKDLAYSTPDKLVKKDLKSDSSTVFGFEIQNDPAISAKILEKVVDSLRRNDPVIASKNAEALMYSKTKFKSHVKDAKAILVVNQGDTVATYKDNNWNLSYNYRNTTFDAEYTNTGEAIIYNDYKYSLANFKYGKPKIVVDKWFNDKNIVVEQSETILAPIKKDNVDFKVYVSPEYSITNKSITTGAGAELRIKNFGTGVRYDYNTLDKSNRPQHEIKVNVKYYLINK